ncbi:phosphate ABC transporter permease PstA [Solicola sp. PLA-1-18]|uniref:phosphate ABC transporter permease PstA n=1 Tax=Solicola sp. PLA-1-18 TaxID=3380532 RepID=UPI003B7B8D1F
MALDTTARPTGPAGLGDGPSLKQPSLPRQAGWGLTAAAVLLGIGLKTLGFSWVPAIVLAWLALIVVVSIWSISVEGGRRATDRIVTVMVTSAFALAMVPLVQIMYTVISKGAAVMGVDFFTFSMRNVVGEGGGIYHAIWGTVLITLATTVMSVPIGIFTAIYLVEYGANNRLSGWIRFLVDVMTGIPSIVAGLFAYALFVVFFGPGVRMGFAGAVALAVLMIPVVVRSVEEMLKLVPNELREASYALGVPKWRTIVKVVLPTSLAGIVTGVTLAVARVIGETAPLLITVGVSDSVNFNIFDGRMATLPVFAFNSIQSPGFPPAPSIERAWGAALVLMIIVMLLNLVARLVSYVFSPKGER